ncbi:MAG: neutral zinc metallopeptidase [Niabella sp.]
MKWRNSRESDNVEDRRGLRGRQVVAGGGIAGVIIYLLFAFLGGGEIDPSQLTQMTQTNQTSTLSPEEQAADDERAAFVKVILGKTEDVWNKLFREQGQTYKEPTLVLFRGKVESACGYASAASGPFYCPGDQKLYIDLSFFEELEKLTNKSQIEFAMAYVIAHEVGHHIQNLNGTATQMQKLRSQVSEEQYNRYSVKMELQADFLAGVWAHYEQQMKNSLEPGDIEEALTAANAIGDDRLQKQSQGYVVPDAFTHGTSQQRMYWFKKGYQTGNLSQGDTFNDPSLR